jgi:hypothetical protein
MATQEADRASKKLSQLETLQKIRGTEEKFQGEKALREEQRAAEVLKAKNLGVRAAQDSQARAEVDSVSRLDMAYSTNNQALWDATIDGMSPGTREALEGVPAAQIPQMLKQMRQVAVRNLEQLRARDLEANKQQQMGARESATSRQDFQQKKVLQEAEHTQRGYEARLGAGVPGMIENMKPEDPEAADQYGRDYIESAITKNENTGISRTSQRDLNEAYDRSVKAGMEATASSIIAEYQANGVEIADVDADSIADMPGWGAMRTEANKWAKLGASGSDIHDGLMANYILIDEDKGFVPMPKNTRGERVGTKTALDLLKEARDTGEDINEVVRRYGRRIEHTTGIVWNHGL